MAINSSSSATIFLASVALFTVVLEVRHGFARVIIPRDCPAVCSLREACPALPDRLVAESICDVTQDGDIFVCCDPAAFVGGPDNGPPPPAPDPPKGGVVRPKCPLSAQQGECGLTHADRIWNGETAATGQFPWTAALLYKIAGVKGNTHLCGGALITDRHVLTAAHCIVHQAPQNRNDRGFTGNLTEIRLGERILSSDPDCSTSGVIKKCDPRVQKFSPAKITVHPEYSRISQAVLYDIAVVELDRPVNLEVETVAPVCLPCGGVKTSDILTRAPLSVSGWGAVNGETIRSDTLLFARVAFLPFDECRTRFAFGDRLDPGQHLCSGTTVEQDQDACRGDSGGPLTASDADDVSYLVGLVSYGTRQCGRGSIGVYTNVEGLLPWILDVVSG